MKPEHLSAEITTAELRQILADGSAFVFDARPPPEYAISHIPGSLNVGPKPGVGLAHYVADVTEIERIMPDKTVAIVLYSNGPSCEQSHRLAEELLTAGFIDVRRYQLGIPTWRALVGLTQIELDGARYVFAGDKTAVWVDARRPEEFVMGSLPGAVNVIDKEDVVKAKTDQRFPMYDHNTRMIVFGKDGKQAQAVAEAIVRNAFHNVSFFGEVMEEPSFIAEVARGTHDQYTATVLTCQATVIWSYPALSLATAVY